MKLMSFGARLVRVYAAAVFWFRNRSVILYLQHASKGLRFAPKLGRPSPPLGLFSCRFGDACERPCTGCAQNHAPIHADESSDECTCAWSRGASRVRSSVALESPGPLRRFPRMLGASWNSSRGERVGGPGHPKALRSLGLEVWRETGDGAGDVPVFARSTRRNAGWQRFTGSWGRGRP